MRRFDPWGAGDCYEEAGEEIDADDAEKAELIASLQVIGHTDEDRGDCGADDAERLGDAANSTDVGAAEVTYPERLAYWNCSSEAEAVKEEAGEQEYRVGGGGGKQHQADACASEGERGNGKPARRKALKAVSPDGLGEQVAESVHGESKGGHPAGKGGVGGEGYSVGQHSREGGLVHAVAEEEQPEAGGTQSLTAGIGARFL